MLLRLCSLIACVLAEAALVQCQAVLVFTKATDYYHESIPTAEMAIQQLGVQHGFPVIVNNDSSVFSDSGLRGISAIAFVSNSESLAGPPILTDDQQSAFLRFLGQGGGYVGIHAASACLFSVPFYKTLVGAYFDYHPDLQQASFLVVNRSNPSTADLPSPWTFVEEVYSFYSDPRQNNVTVMMSVNETSYTDPDQSSYEAQYNQGTPHPIMWLREASSPGLYLGNSTYHTGRTWYSSLGHTVETWQNSTFLQHVGNGITWVLATTSAGTSNSASAAPSSTAGGTAAAFTPTSTSTSATATPSKSATGSASAPPGVIAWVWPLLMAYPML